MRPATRVLALMVAVLASATLVAQEPSFRITTDMVTVDVLAFRGREPIGDLTADDFELTDNGVPQAISSVTVPGGAHVIVALDTSSSVEGQTLTRLSEALTALLDRLSGEDRVSLLAFGDRVRILLRAATPAVARTTSLAGVTAAGGTALHDALVLSSALTHADGRPALLLVFTDGADTASWTTADGTLRALRAANVVVFPVGAGLATSTPATSALRAPSPYLSSPTWLGADATDATRLLDRVARVTGGTFIRVGRAAALERTFTEIIERYRQRYVLSYAPTGVGRGDGWHRIEVTLKSQRGSVQAREGYVAGR